METVGVRKLGFASGLTRGPAAVAGILAAAVQMEIPAADETVFSP